MRSLPGIIRALLLGAAVVLLAACADGDETAPSDEGDEAGPRTFTIRAGEADDSIPNAGLFAFYPSAVKVHAGDIVVIENGSGEIPVPHTITLGTPADIPDRIPPPLAPEVGQVPAAWGKCVSEQQLDPRTTDCPAGSAAFPPAEEVVSMPDFDSQGFYNSGIFDPEQSVELPLSDGISPGTYNFFCYLHPGTMTLQIDVVGDDESTQTQDDLDAQADEQRQEDLADAMTALEAGQQADLPEDTVLAGSERGNAVVTAFFPQEITVQEGTEVTWINRGFDPHVVAMERGVGPHDPENFGPPSVPPGSEYDGGFEISGVFGNPPFPTKRFSLKFVEEGEYIYVCPIHPGMGGTIRVSGT
jgi:plastocyanin